MRITLIGSLLTIFFSCSVPSKEELKFKQYMIEGRNVYLAKCINCHGKDGQGLGRLYPPLVNADWLKKDYIQILCIAKNGINGKLIINNKEFNQAMPANPSLTALELAEVATYISNSWGNEFRMIKVNEAIEVLNECDN